MEFKIRNVNDGFRTLVDGISSGEIPTKRTSSRNGDVLRIQEPITITYNYPQECVLFNQARDANCFFHLFEALWMLAGCNDVASVAYYAASMTNYSDNGETLHGAYGYRWIKAFGYNQLRIIIHELKKNPDSRRCVLQMWDAHGVLNSDLYIATHGGKDVPCNVCAFFEVVDGEVNMTVVNRSNDIVWGLFGANAVHFSFLLMYVAGNLGLKIGKYHQFTANAHIYTENNSGFKHEEWLAEYQDTLIPDAYVQSGPWDVPAGSKPLNLVKLVQDPAVFERELPLFVEAFSGDNPNDERHGKWKEPFLDLVASPMLWAFNLHKKRLYETALNAAKNIMANDWRIAATNWLNKRQQSWENKNAISK